MVMLGNVVSVARNASRNTENVLIPIVTRWIYRRDGMRLIDADALEREGWSLCRTFQKDKDTMVYEVKKPSDFLTIEERKTGKWIYITDGHYEYFKCDQCEKHSGEPTPFCRYCGADMREGQYG